MSRDGPCGKILPCCPRQNYLVLSFFDIIAESIRSDVKVIAEGHGALTDRAAALEKRQDSMQTRQDRLEDRQTALENRGAK